MSTRLNISSEAKWEDVVGYSRAVKIGNIIEISGTTAVDEKGVVATGNTYEQAKFILEKISKTLIEAGSSISDVIRTRMYTTDITKWEDIAKAHSEYFGDIKPATSLVEVKKLIEPGMVIEIEATAVLSEI
ncbi:MAG: RidA family protein [Bacteroidota bacterium]